MSKNCECSLRIKLVGDGCEMCNPAKALEHAKAEVERLYIDKRRCHAMLADVYDSFSGEDNAYDWDEVLRELRGCESGKCTDKCEAEVEMLEAEVERLTAERERCGAEYLGRVCTLASGHPPAGVVLWHIGVDGVPWTEHVKA